MKNPAALHTLLKNLSVAASLLTCGTPALFSQAAPTSQDVQAMIAEIRDLRTRLAAVEAKLASYAPTTPVPSTTRPATEPQPPAPSGPTVSSGEQAPAAKPAPFAFGDFTWMNGQSRQK